MRIIIFLLLIWCVGCSNDSVGYKFALQGKIGGIKYGKVLLLEPGNPSKILFTTDLDNGKFQFKGELEETGRYILRVNRKSFYFFMDGKDMYLDCTYKALNEKYLKGSPANDLEMEYNEMMQEKYYTAKNALVHECTQQPDNKELVEASLTKILAMEEDRFALTREFVREHPDNIFSAYISDVVKAESYEKGQILYDLLSEKNKASFFGRLLKEHTETLAVSALGVDCPDFTVLDESGKEVTLNAQKGEIMVLDFWASWCGPCRGEMVNLREQYAEFKDRGVRFMSISLDDSVKKWEKACEEEKIPWLSTRDTGGWAKSKIRELFGIQSIPFIVLLDSEGKIVAKNIRRDSLRKKIIELLDKK